MMPLKSGKHIIGAKLTAAEQKAMDMEIKRQLREWDEVHAIELEALYLWTLHEVFGFGEKRLRRLHDSIVPAIESLLARYELEEKDDVWLCTKKLKEAGIDIERWNIGGTLVEHSAEHLP